MSRSIFADGTGDMGRISWDKFDNLIVVSIPGRLHPLRPLSEYPAKKRNQMTTLTKQDA
jgi:hypothetical protein